MEYCDRCRKESLVCPMDGFLVNAGVLMLPLRIAAGYSYFLPSLRLLIWLADQAARILAVKCNSSIRTLILCDNKSGL